MRDLLGHWVRLPPRKNEDGMCPHACCKGRRPHPDRFPVMLPKSLLRTMSQAELEAHFEKPGVGGNGRAVRQVIGEMERRERASKAREQRASHRASKDDEYRVYLEDQFVRAEASARGNLLTRRGQARGIDPRAMWTSRQLRDRYASDEAKAWFDAHPPVSKAEFSGGEASQVRGARRRRSAQLYGVY